MFGEKKLAIWVPIAYNSHCDKSIGNNTNDLSYYKCFLSILSVIIENVDAFFLQMAGFLSRMSNSKKKEETLASSHPHDIHQRRRLPSSEEEYETDFIGLHEAPRDCPCGYGADDRQP
ncbi:hypothetical protein, partial [Mitsuokella jalaludinii]|uniref:hypothetical protein n=1 Tax=Mitsuokella jalaludinii TaxID=187979 RepID=UPI00307FF76D